MKLFAFFESEGNGSCIANLGRSEILDSAGINEAGIFCPFGSVSFKELEGCAVKLNKSLADNGLVLAVSSFDVHHLGHRHTACNPFFSRLAEVGNLGKIAGVAILNKHECVVAERIAIVGIEVRGECATALIAEEVMKRRELAVIGACSLASLEVFCNERREELFRLDKRNLNVAVGIALEEELLLDGFGKNCENSHRLFGEACFDERIFFCPSGKSVECFGLFACEKLVDLGNENRKLGNELNDALGNDSNAEVPALCRTGCNRICDIICDLSNRHLLCGNLFAYKADVGTGLKRTFKCNVRSGTAHYLNEMPIFLCRVGIALDVADDLAVGFGCGIEAERAFDIFVLKVAIDGFGATDNLNACVVSSKIFCQNSRVGVGIVAADDNDSIYAVLFANLGNDCELLFGFELGSARADDIKAAGVAVLIDIRPLGPPLKP